MASKRSGQCHMTVDPIRSVHELEERLSEPTPEVIEAMSRFEGNILILGACGKIGPTLCRMAARAVRASGVGRKVIAVSAFPERQLRESLETIAADLLEPDAMERLPEAENVLYLVGRKFGSTGSEWETWATNVVVAGHAAHRYRNARIVAFSTGCVYPLVPILSGGATEATPMEPVGEYAMSCVGRERLFDYYAHKHGTRLVQLRLNYAVELRYGVVVDIATQVRQEQAVNLAMGHFNCVWQGYVNAVALRCLALADALPPVLNVTGPELASVRWLALRLGELMGKEPRFVGKEAETALLSNAALCHKLFGLPSVSIETLAEWIAYWVTSEGALLQKPTHYATRDGKY